MKTRICLGCGKEFRPTNNRQKYCRKKCRMESSRSERLEYQHQYYVKNREKKLEYCQEYRRVNREKVSEWRRRYYEKNRERIAERNRMFREANPDYSHSYYERNRDKALEYQKRYYRANRERIADYQKWYRNGGNVEIMMRRNAQEAKTARIPDEPSEELRETSRLADVKPDGCMFEGSCLDCPYPECVEV